MNVALRDDLLDCLDQVLEGLATEGVLNLSDAWRMVPSVSVEQLQQEEQEFTLAALKGPVYIATAEGVARQRRRKVGFELADLFERFERNVETLRIGDPDDQLWTYKIEVIPGVIYCIEFYKKHVYKPGEQRKEWVIKTGSIAVYKGDDKYEFTGANDLERFRACRESVETMGNITLQFVNLTPDTFITLNNGGELIYTPQGVAYVVPTERTLYKKEGIWVTHMEREVRGLPESEEGKIYIVTHNVLDALDGTRTDVVAIGESVDLYGRMVVRSFITL